MDINNIKSKLNGINWDFDFKLNYNQESLHPFNCRDYYSYPATFIPEIPYTLIEILTKKGDVVVDPFGGIGTTFMQALILERIPYSFDINPVASNVCQLLFELFNPSLDRMTLKKYLLDLVKCYSPQKDYTICLSDKRKELKDWFEHDTFNELSFLFEKYDQMNDHIVHDTLRIIISSLLVTLSSQNKGWAYIADNVKPRHDELRNKSVYDFYKMAVKKMVNDVDNQIRNTSTSFPTFYKSIESEKHVFTDSIDNSGFEKKCIDLVITSPPYPRMIDYVKSQRLAFYFLEDNYNKYTESEIGARYRRARKNGLFEYQEMITKINCFIVERIKKNGYYCIVLPDYTSDDNRKETIEKIIKGYADFGLEKIFDVRRYIPSNKRTLSIQWASLVNERIIVFQKG